jgi:hypothetical protein
MLARAPLTRMRIGSFITTGTPLLHHSSVQTKSTCVIICTFARQQIASVTITIDTDRLGSLPPHPQPRNTITCKIVQFALPDIQAPPPSFSLTIRAAKQPWSDIQNPPRSHLSDNQNLISFSDSQKISAVTLTITVNPDPPGTWIQLATPAHQPTVLSTRRLHPMNPCLPITSLL